jgi:hypothetical protein
LKPSTSWVVGFPTLPVGDGRAHAGDAVCCALQENIELSVLKNTDYAMIFLCPVLKSWRSAMPSPIPIQIHFPVALLHALTGEAVASGRGLEAVVLRTLESTFGAPPTAPVTYDIEVAQATERCKALPPGTLFSLNADFGGSRRLFSRDEWQTLISNSAFRPTVFGRQFSKAILAASLAKAKEKTGDNKQIYERL